MKQSKVKEPAQEIQFWGMKQQDRHYVPMDVINNVTAIFSSVNK